MPTTKSHSHTSTAVAHQPTNSSAPSTSSGGGLGRTTTVIIAVVASVGGIVFILLFTRFIRRRRNRQRATPLPPVQPIAHHREQQIARFEEDSKYSLPGTPGSSRPISSWLTSPGPPSGTASDASLIPNKDYDFVNASGKSSPSPHRQPSDISLQARRIADQSPLPHPTPAFHQSNQRHSSGSSERLSTVSSPLTAPESPTTASFSHSSHSPLISPPIVSPRPRPSSMISTTSRASRKSQIRGVPHAPHSGMQIVLPTPLAPGLSPYGHDGSVGSRASSHRLSVADQWAGVSVKKGESQAAEDVERDLKVERKRSWGGFPSGESSMISMLIYLRC